MSHLTLNDRIEIQIGLSKNLSLKEIARKISKSPSTVSREIRNHLIVRSRTEYPSVRMMNDCKNRFKCKKNSICHPGCRFKKGKCSFCGNCYKYCGDYEKEVCPSLLKPPYVCNDCSKRNTCRLEQKYYKANLAHEEYSNVLKEIRSGFNFTEEELAYLNNALTPLVKDNKQSIHHACLVLADKLLCDEKTIYNLIDANMFPNIKNIDLPRKCGLKPRESKNKKEHKVDKKCRINRTYEDYQNYLTNNPDVTIVEMDTVEGVKGGKCIITFLFKDSHLQLYYLVDQHTSQQTIQVIDELYEHILGPELFKKLFELILTDNGSEFSNPTAIENDAFHQPRTKVFYCNPSASYQKGTCENNHKLLRKFLPKGTSFNNLTQEQLNVISSHINSYKRKRLNDHSPIEAFSLLYGKETLSLFGIKEIEPENVCLSINVIK